jgi:hypothetical protein
MRRLCLIGVLSGLRVLTVLVFLLVFVLSLWFSIEGFVIGVIHGDSAIRKSEGRSGSNDSRVPRSASRIQKSVGVADYINSTEEFGNFCLLSLVMIGKIEEQRVGKGGLHVETHSIDCKTAIGNRAMLYF